MLVGCLLVGMILRATHRAPDNAHVAINAFIIHVAPPALILAQINGPRLTTGLLPAGVAFGRRIFARSMSVSTTTTSE